MPLTEVPPRSDAWSVLGTLAAGYSVPFTCSKRRGPRLPRSMDGTGDEHMTSLAERRRLNPDLGKLGIAGLALLRLHALREPDERAIACVEEMQRILTDVD